MGQAWVRRSAVPPRTAWTGPARWDAYAGIKGLVSMRTFDPAFYVTAVGDAVFFGSSVDDAVHCLDARTGQDRWISHTGGPVRLPPSWHGGKLYAGSDDGHAYCLDARTGSVVWKRKPSREDRLMLWRGKLISHWPCRTGVLIQDGKAYFGASLLPWKVSYLCAVDAATGSEKGPGCYVAEHALRTMQGALLASSTNLYVPQGRQRPEVFDLATGAARGAFGKSGDGGVFALVTRDGTFIHGRGQNHGAGGELRGFDERSRDYLATFPRATCMVATDTVAYLNTGTELAAFDRVRYLTLARERRTLQAKEKELKDRLKKLAAAPQEADKARGALARVATALRAMPARFDGCFTWRTACAYPHTLILAGTVLFAGGNGAVAAFDARSGRQLWRAPVSGKALGIAAARGRLFVSTDTGSIHCFQ
jgi:outer membrane protein assembly factor BamB